ncbi:MAG: copper transport protein [Candidatus Aldehydirespiratoraceae bacterium]|jgi:copper transport protein
MYSSLRPIGPRAGATAILVASWLLVTALPAAAHTGFESSSPADGDTIVEPVFEISLTFSGEATPAGDGFVVLDPAGVTRIPDEVTSSGDLTWTIRFDEPLAGGTVGVRWKVAAPDAHPIEGSFSFVVETPAVIAATSTTLSPTTLLPSTPTTAAPPEPAIAEALPATQVLSASVTLAEFLDTRAESAAGAARVGDLGRVLSLLGVVFAFGGVAFAALTLRGDRRDIRAVLIWVRRAGLLTMIGAAIEAAVQIATVTSSWSGLWSSSAISDGLASAFGVAVLLRFSGGALVVAGTRLNVHRASTADGDDAWHITKSPAAFVGAALLVLSFTFDGHTVSEGPRWVHAVANAIHVATAATWAGGVVMLALVITRRRRRGADTRALQLAVRFSVVATIALVAAAAAGAALTFVILDSVSELWATPWGRLLMAKVVLVSLAAAFGGHNHRTVIPALERSPDNADTIRRFRTIVSIEAVLLIIVTVLTGVLIAASST